ncbi:hypothetical protein C8F01DRAFT_1368422 [Mycena amicta]|nr:hypothetical protein C8F01DRAFT_1368422 [Mycena amicta]
MITFGLSAPLILGVMEIGTFVSLFLFGVVAIQGFVYFSNCRADTLGLRLFVGSVLFLELCHSIASCHVIYAFTVLEAGLPELAKPANTYSLSLTPVLETLITTLVQGFFGYRIYLLSGRLYIAMGCWFLCVLRFLSGMSLAVVAFMDVPLEPDFFHLQNTYGWIIAIALNVGVVLDLVITVVMCVHIRKMYTPYIGDMPRGQDIIQRLIMWTIQTGLITSMTSVAVEITFQTMRRNFVWLALYTLLAKLYSNSLLVLLNARPPPTITLRTGSSSPLPPPSPLSAQTLDKKAYPYPWTRDRDSEIADMPVIYITTTPESPSVLSLPQRAAAPRYARTSYNMV